MDSKTTEDAAHPAPPQRSAPPQRAAGFSPRGPANNNTAPDSQQRLWDDSRLAAPHEQDDKADRIRRMFNAISPTYERVNFVASVGRDRAWRRYTVRQAEVQSNERILDIACGTGDLARAFARAQPQLVVGLDFAQDMLRHAVDQSCESGVWVQADALRLPFADGSFDITACAFGVRNFQHLETGLREMHRVLKPGGRAMILEFTMPDSSLLRGLYHFYFAKIMPRLAAWISRDRTGAYQYLPRSVVSFLNARQLTELIEKVGFASVRAKPMTFGAVHVYRADKAS